MLIIVKKELSVFAVINCDRDPVIDFSPKICYIIISGYT